MGTSTDSYVRKKKLTKEQKEKRKKLQEIGNKNGLIKNKI